jgi:hypothetical protein
MDRPPGWAESFFAGRSHADREADQEAMLRALLVVGAFLGLIALGLNALFTFAGLRFGWWAVPVFVPVGGWLFASAVCNRLLRPLELDVLRWGQRLRAAGVLMVVLWLVWPARSSERRRSRWGWLCSCCSGWRWFWRRISRGGNRNTRRHRRVAPNRCAPHC